VADETVEGVRNAEGGKTEGVGTFGDDDTG